MTTERLEEFAVLANVLNYGKAAEKLYISQSILSRHIKELEKEVGAPLFDRSTHGVTLTEEGKYFLQWVLPLLRKTEKALSALSDDRMKSGGQVHLICQEQTLNTLVLRFLREFLRDHPAIDLAILPNERESSPEQLYSADLLLTPCDFMHLAGRDIEGQYLLSQQTLLAIPPFHHFGDMEEISLAALRGEDLIVPYADELFGPNARNAMAANRKCHGILRKIPAETSQAGLLMVELGRGVMLIPHHLKHRVYPMTRTIPVTDAECGFPIYLYHNRTAGNPAAELLYELFSAWFHPAAGEGSYVR